MTQEDKIVAIRAKCVELREIASKRTSGEWHYNDPDCSAHVIMAGDTGVCSGVVMGKGVTYEQSLYNAHFISSCAGAAEAGWQTTIVIIDAMEQLHENTQEHLARTILTAWQPIMNFPTTERPR
jgi:hypothetical protein